MSFETVNTQLKTCSTNLENSLQNIDQINKSLDVLTTADLSLENINVLLQSLGQKIINGITVNGVDNIMDIVYKSTDLTLSTDKRVINDKDFLMSFKETEHYNLIDNADPQNTNNFLIFFIGLNDEIVSYQKIDGDNEHLKNTASLVEKISEFKLDNIVYEPVNYIELLSNDSKYKLVIVHEAELRVL